MLTYLLILAIPVSAVALLCARWEYRKRGRLTALGIALLCLMLLVPNLVLEYATRYQLPRTALDYLGVVVGVAGLALCVTGIFNFDSMAKVFGLQFRDLTRSGFYRWSRNPQYLGWWLFLLGFSLTDWSLWCLAVLAVEAISLHLLVLIEEEHLRRLFGQPYVDYCAGVPRYAGWSPSVSLDLRKD